MIGERTESALKRIDAAVARIEQGTARLKAAASQQADHHARLSAAAAEQAAREAAMQAERHARLREAVTAAMRDLDGLIGRAGATLASVEQVVVEQAVAAQADGIGAA